MTSPSILGMNQTVALNEQRAEEREKSLPPSSDSQHYWHVERKAKRGNRWLFHAHFYGSKRDVAEYWRKNFQDKSKQFRLRHLLKY